MNVLVIAPHPDDEAIGCGGALRLHVERGDRVVALFLSSGELGLKDLPREEAWRVRESEAAAAAEVLGLHALSFLRLPDWFVGEFVEQAASRLMHLLERETPDRVYVPHPAEWHPDHRAAPCVLRAALRGGRAPEVLAYEVWTPLASYDRVEDITRMMGAKLRAVRAYRSQVRDLRYDRAVRGLNAYRGALAGRCRYAEVFQGVACDPVPFGSGPAGGPGG